MPFIVNGQKVNKPIYEGVVLNAIHVWLQNHWTGTANASTSTLSQDGAVVATNLDTCPNPVDISHWGAYDNFSTSTIDGGDFLVRFNGTTTGVVTMGSPHRPSGMIPVTPGEAIVGAMRVKEDIALGNTSLLLQIRDSAGAFIANIPTQVVLTPGEWVTLVAQVTVPDNGVFVRVLLFGDATGLVGSVRGRNRAVYTLTDYQAMQARGVTWFDGDSYVRGGV